MKLLQYTNRKLFFLLFFLLGIWGVFFYITVIDEVMDETDDTLENYREIIVNKVLMNPELLKSEDNVMGSYVIRPITDKEAARYDEKFYNSTVYIETEDEYEPVRIMKSCFLASDHTYYELELRLSTLERDDMVEAILWYLSVLYVLLLLCVILGTYFILKTAFKPLHKLLHWLDKVVPGRQIPVLENETSITEFSKLNESALAMSRRSELAYQEQKQFIENAAHELQTPLAISRGKLELLAESQGLSEKQLMEIDELYRTLGRAVKLNKSLLLLSRINNEQYPETTEVNMNAFVHDLLSDLMEIYEYKNIKLSTKEEGECTVRMNESLAQILISNLLKNALVHTPEGGSITIVISQTTFAIINSGDKPLDSEKVFQRFYRTDMDKKDSNGLGLAIVQSIVRLYGMSISYSYCDGNHSFMLKLVK